MATKTLIARQGLRDLFLVEILHPSGALGRFYEGVIYLEADDGRLKELSEKPTFSLNQRDSADLWLSKGGSEEV